MTSYLEQNDEVTWQYLKPLLIDKLASDMQACSRVGLQSFNDVSMNIVTYQQTQNPVTASVSVLGTRRRKR